MSDLPQQLTLPLEKHHNHYLFSDYYLDHLLPRRLDWQGATGEARAAMKRLQTIYAAFTPTENEAQTERDWIRPVLEALSHVFEVQPSIATPDGVRRPDYVFFPTKKARQAAKPLQGQENYPATALAVGDAKHWDRSLDQTLKGEGRKPRDPFTNKNPSWQIYFYMLHTGQAWGILTNGRAWRLYHRDTAHKLNYYYEVDLPALLDNGDVEAFKYFYLFFRQASFIPNGEGRTWLDIILQESRDYAQGVSENLKEQVYDALRHVAQGFLDCTGSGLAPDSDTLKAIYDNSLILLYRLLFILYAESRGLLPLQENETYRLTYSLDAIKKEIERTLSKPILPTSRLYWPRLEELFGAINKGNEHLGVPAYNGDLFDPQKHPFLEQYAVGDHGLRQAIDLLARIDTEEGRVFVDYRDLEVRHLGSIYEGLLEYQLRHAEEDLAVVKEKGRERYVPASEGQEVAVLAGRVYLVTDRGERKATGSYYTPDYIVKYIVEQTLEPLLDETFARWADRKNVTEEDLIDDILSLDVLDPAMGSGHFLVEATEYIARYLVGLGLEATAGMKAEAELDYWKRRVVQSCIYGVDLNPLAVELAKLSLWLITVSKDKPLSFLDHHLRCGNSLIGARVADLGAAPVVKKRRKAEEEAAGQLSMFEDDAFRQSMMTAVDSMWLIERTSSDDVAGVKEQERIYQELRDELTRRYRRLADLWTARYFGVEYDVAMWPGLVSYATGHAPAQVPQYEAMLKQAGAIAEDKHFFHWELEFPEVFFDRFGRPLKDQAGFDAVVGNPPYHKERDYKHEFDVIKQGPVGIAYYEGKMDLWHLFVHQGLSVLRNDGVLSFISNAYWTRGEGATKLISRIISDTYFRSYTYFADHPIFADVSGLHCVFVLVNSKKRGPHTAYLIREDAIGSSEVEKKLSTHPREFFDELQLPTQKQLLTPHGKIAHVADVTALVCTAIEHRSVELGSIASTFQGVVENPPKLSLRAIERLRASKPDQFGKWNAQHNYRSGDPVFVVPKELVSEVCRTPEERALLRPYYSAGGIGRYTFDSEPSGFLIYSTRETVQDISDFPNLERHLRPYRPFMEARRETREGKIGWFHLHWPRVDRNFQAPKLIVPQMQEGPFCCFVDIPYYVGMSANFVHESAPYDLRYICAVLNSNLLRWYVVTGGRAKRRGVKVDVTIGALKRLPIRRISFTTSPEERSRLVKVRITEATEWIEGTGGLSVSFSGSNLGRWLDARLPMNPDGSPDTDHEQSDVVHDLLAHLAEQMIEMNKQKQAEVRGFLDWLADYTGRPVEDWTLKTSLKAYYQHDWTEIRRVLDRNRRKITKVDVQGRAASEQICGEWEASTEKLEPLLARIAATDWLIDLIVYRLYGLTEEEVAVVEGVHNKNAIV